MARELVENDFLNLEAEGLGTTSITCGSDPGNLQGPQLENHNIEAQIKVLNKIFSLMCKTTLEIKPGTAN